MKLPYHVHEVVTSEFDRLRDALFGVDYFYKIHSHESNCDKLKELVSSLCDNDVTIIDEYHRALTAYEEVYDRLSDYLYVIINGLKDWPRFTGTFVVNAKGKIVKPKQRHASAQ